MAVRKTYTKVCKRCQGEYQSYRNTRKPGVCWRQECLVAEADEHNAAVEAARAELAAKPRQPRATCQQQPLYGDYAWVAAVNGIDPATGRKRGA